MDMETLDDMDPGELMDFWVKHQGGRGSKSLFPGMRKNRINLTGGLANYAANLATAKSARLEGRIEVAIKYERIVEAIRTGIESKYLKEI